LLRLQLEGIPAGDRWPPLAQAWTRLLTPGFYPFNDMHAIMAYVGAGDLARAAEVVAALGRPGCADPRRGGLSRPALSVTEWLRIVAWAKAH
jgi:hypothetical protein